MCVTAERTITALPSERDLDKTICPSEAARALALDEDCWRDEMDTVHRAVDMLLEAGVIRLTWKGKPMSERRGPYRIALRSPH